MVILGSLLGRYETNSEAIRIEMTLIKSIFAVSAAVLAVCMPLSAQAQDTAPLTSIASGGDPAKGKRVFMQCKACHSLTVKGPRLAGPNLAGLIGRAAGGDEKYTRYSEAFKTADFVWTEDTLYEFLEDPNAYLPGVQATMRVRKVKKEQDRKDVIAFLRQATASE